MAVFRLFVVYFTLAGHLSFAKWKLDNSEQIYTCEIDGIVDQNIHQLHGTLVNCQSPPMKCSIDRDEYLVKSRTNVQCRVPSDSFFFHDDKACSFRFYYRRSYCLHNNRCYSLTMSCHSVVNPTLLLILLVILGCIFILLLVTCLLYSVYEFCWRNTSLSIPKQDRRLEKVRRASQRLKEREQENREMTMRLEQTNMETAF